MSLTRKDLEDRLKALEHDRAMHEAQINAIMGAMQECEFWLAKLKKDEPTPLTLLKPEPAPEGV